MPSPFLKVGGSDTPIALKQRMNKHALPRVILHLPATVTISQDVHQRSDIEACGVLLGCQDEQGNWLVEQAHPLRNVFASPVYFEFDPQDLLAIDLAHPGQIIGVYHSHPTGFATASSTDRQNMQRVNQQQQIPWVWLIVKGPFDTLPPRNDIRDRIIAYHHFDKAGLQQLSIILTDGVTMTQKDTPSSSLQG